MTINISNYRIFNKLLITFILVFISNPLYAQGSFKNCLHFFPNGQVPQQLSTQKNTYELCYERFAILYNADNKTPVYVVERLNSQDLDKKGIKRTDKFFAEARLPKIARAELADYKNSGYSRGHMAPAGDMTTHTSMTQSFSLANVVPQNTQHNTKQWAKIEADTRKYIKRASGDIYVFTGPVYLDQSLYIGNHVRVPAFLFKLIYDPQRNQSWAYWSKNEAQAPFEKLISQDELTKRVKIIFIKK